MAAHPFGPIENQLIVGYYKRGFSPARVRPTLNFTKSAVVLDTETRADDHLLKPVFYGWSPANGNSSSHDFRATWVLRQLEMTRLLGRGLGYRITFTMPEQEVSASTDPKKIFPQGVLELLDFFGEKVTARLEMKVKDYVKSNVGNTDQEVLEHIGQFQKVQFEHTLFHFKIIENGTEEYLFPVYSPPGSSIDERHLAAAERHRSLLKEHEGYYGMMMRTDPVDYLMKNAEQIFDFISEHQKIFSAEQKQRMRVHIEAAVGRILWALSSKPEAFTALHENLKSRLQKMVNNLESDIRKWLDDEGPFPRYISVSTIRSIRQEVEFRELLKSLTSKEAFANHFSSKPEAEQIFDALGIFNPERLQRLASRILSNQVRQVAPLVLSFNTKNFTIQKADDVYNFFKTGVMKPKKFKLRKVLDEEFGLKADDICLLSEADCLLVRSEPEKFSNPSTYCMIDLAALHAMIAEKDRTQDPCSALPRCRLPHTSNNSLVSAAGIVGWQKGANSLDLEYYPVRGDNPKEESAWLSLKLEIALPEVVSALLDHKLSAGCTQIETLVAHNQKRLYLAEGKHSFNIPWGIWFCVIGVDTKNNHLGCLHQEFVSLEEVSGDSVGWQSLQWIEAKEERVFACAFTPDCRLWAFMYWKGRFVCAGKNRRTTLKPFSLGSRLSEICKLGNFSHNEGLLGVQHNKPEVDGPHFYKFTRIALLY